MVTVTFETKNGNLLGVHVSGHAGFNKRGKDIVCAAISSLTITLINSLDILTDCDFNGTIEEESGDAVLHIIGEPSEDVTLLLKAFEIGVRGIEQSYSKFIYVDYKEV